ncbi:MAG: folate family ECF transporter S component [Clostridia bacterium]|nr:folate family ECF transporter S component [Clostridia bacterium]
MQKLTTKQMIFCAVLACVGGVLSGPLSFHFMTWKISFGNIPVMLAGIVFGPIAGGLTGFVSDFINWLLKPTGAYNPLFGIVAALVGIISGLVYKHKDNELQPNLMKTLVTAGITQIICSFILNTLIMVLVYGATPALFITKLVYNIVMIPVMAAVLHGVLTSVLLARIKLNKA